MKDHISLLRTLITGIIFSCLAFQTQAVTLTFDDGVNGSSAETFYQGYGVTFSGGGLLSGGSSGGLAGQPVFSGTAIGTLVKEAGVNYSDSFFDMWIHFDHDVYDVSGDYIGNALFGGTVTAYNDLGVALDTNYPPSPSSYSFSTLDAIAEIHMISDSAAAGVYLDNLTFDASSVPEPTTGLLLGSSLIALVVLNRKRKQLIKKNY